MLWVIVVLVFISESLAYYGDLRIVGGGSSGQLQFDTGYGGWGAICMDGFDDDAGDVACKQLGYVQSSEVYTYSYSSYSGSLVICDIFCDGSEDELTDCYLTSCAYSSCYNGVVGVSCTNSRTTGQTADNSLQIAGIVVGSVVFIALIVLIITLCICCLSPTCPWYYRRNHTTNTVVVTRQQAIPQVMTTPAPAYYPDTGYQPYPSDPPTAATAKY